MKNPKIIESRKTQVRKATIQTVQKYSLTIALFIALLIGFVLGRI